MFETHRLLEAAGILHAGSGRNLAEARMARTAATPKGTVAAIGLYSIDASSNPPRTRFYGATATTPGLNPLHLNVLNVVSADQMQSLKQIRDSIHARRPEVPLPVAPVPANEPANRLRLFQTGFTVGARPGAPRPTTCGGRVTGGAGRPAEAAAFIARAAGRSPRRPSPESGDSVDT